MNKHKIEGGQLLASHFCCSCFSRRCFSGRQLLATILAVVLFTSLPINAAVSKTKAQKVAATSAQKKIIRPIPASTEIVPSLSLSLGQSHLIRLEAGSVLQKVKVEDDKIVQIDVTSPRELLLHAKSVGTTVVFILDKAGQTAVMDVRVLGVTTAMDATALQAKFQQVMPNEKSIKVSTAADSLVLTGMVADAVKVDKAMALAEAYGGKDKEKKVINMLQVSAPQQVMLEVKMAEVSKNLLDQLGANFSASRTNGDAVYGVLSAFSIGAAGQLTFNNGITSVTVEADHTDIIVKILAEPNIMAISGQEGSFLAGGKFYIPVPQGGTNNAITLEEKDFGVGLKFTPTVLEDGLINLKVAPEVTELAKTSDVQNTTISNYPTLITRRVSTTVQLHDGQSFAIAGLLKNNITEQIKRFPILGDIPILGALFRSSSFQNEKTELLFVVTPRLVKPLPANYALPTDHFKAPSKAEFLLHGQLEARPSDAATNTSSPESAEVPQSGAAKPEQNNAKDGFEMK